jgi:hypothetical protein
MSPKSEWRMDDYLKGRRGMLLWSPQGAATVLAPSRLFRLFP